MYNFGALVTKAHKLNKDKKNDEIVKSLKWEVRENPEVLTTKLGSIRKNFSYV